MTAVALGLFLAYLTLGERVHLGRAPGFPGLPVLEVLFVGGAFLAWFLAGRPMPKARGATVVTVGPLLLLLLLLPLIGVVLGTYGVTTLYSWMVALVPLAVLALTATAGARIVPVCYAAVLIQGVYGLAQTLYRVGVLPEAVGLPIQQWDAETQRSLSEAYVIYGRSTGLFINANTFALWSGVALAFSYFYLSGLRRYSGLAISALGIAGSQSRTGLVCLLVLLVIWAVHTVRTSQAVSRNILPVLVLALPLLVIGQAMGLFRRLLSSQLADRLISALSIIDEGVGADSNVLGRVEAWQLALQYSPLDPRFAMGTLGPPQVQFISFIDNQFVAFYLQGGPLLVGAYLLALCSPLVLRRLGVRRVAPLAAVSIVVVLESTTMTPMFTAQATGLVWVVAMLTTMGLHLGHEAPVHDPEAVHAIPPRASPHGLDVGR